MVHLVCTKKWLLLRAVTILIMSPSPSAGKDSTKAFTIFVQQMNLHGLLKTDDLITRWGEIVTQVKISVQTVVLR